jgi:hypothetical protein
LPSYFKNCIFEGLNTWVQMPEVFRKLGYVFFFYSNEGQEPMHIHVRKAGGFAKF